jgi:hypothetical protein
MSPSHIVTRNAGFFTLATWHYMLAATQPYLHGHNAAKRLLVLTGQKKALGTAVRNGRPQGDLRAAWQTERRARGNHDCALWDTKKNTITVKQPNA